MVRRVGQHQLGISLAHHVGGFRLRKERKNLKRPSHFFVINSSRDLKGLELKALTQMFVLALMAHPFERANQEIYYCSKIVYYPILDPFFWSDKSDS